VAACSGESAPWNENSRVIAIALTDGGPVPAGSDCHGQSYTFDRTTRAFHGETCEAGRKGAVDRTLTPAEASLVVAALTGLEADTDEPRGCGNDADSWHATIIDDLGSVDSYVSHFQFCGEGARGQTLVIASMETVVRAMYNVARVGLKPQTIWSEHSRRLVYSFTPTGPFSGETPPHDTLYYEVSTRQLNGSVEGVPVDRILEPSEAASLDANLANVTVVPTLRCVSSGSLHRLLVDDDARNGESYAGSDHLCAGTSVVAVDEAAIGAVGDRMHALAAR
jgi:hypothetical protein